MTTMTIDRGFKARAGSFLSWAAIAGVAILIGTLLAFIMYRQGVGAEEREHQQVEIADLQNAIDEANERLAKAGETPVNVPDRPEPVYITGEQGPRGYSGLDGADGADGAKGEKGDPGEPGAPGEPGEPGADGATGPPGPAGKDGAQGEKGDDGATGPPGLECPEGQTAQTIWVQTAEEDAVSIGQGTWRQSYMCLAPAP